ncbi:hypothetical protein ACFQ9Q_17580 [Streptomyces virginiae]|uniref:hypothetical protein n=1 Tax=Streptomyces virginiae TaxID=1961 RepID=UPI003677FE13
MRAFLERELRQVEHSIAEVRALLPEAEPATLEHQRVRAARALANRWISLPALTTLKALDDATDPCRCASPTAADRDFFPPVMPPSTETEVAWRLHHATAHPYLVAELATATFTAAATTQLNTAHVRDLGPDASTITLHDHGLRRGSMTHSVPLWARPLLRAAALLRRLGAGTSGPLFRDPRSAIRDPRSAIRDPLRSEGLPSLMAFAESCRLRPPQPPRPKPRRGRRGKTPSVKWPEKTIWPVCTAHYRLSLAGAEPDLMQGCPYPPPHPRKTIELRKKGWLPPDYGPRELRHLR